MMRNLKNLSYELHPATTNNNTLFEMAIVDGVACTAECSIQEVMRKNSLEHVIIVLEMDRLDNAA